jgi:hypothetical protein
MSDLSGSERRKLEKLLGMGGGYVLNFSNLTFGAFFDKYGVEIDAERYCVRGTSKANRMRLLWELDANYIVGHVIDGMIDHGVDGGCFDDSNSALIEDCRVIAKRLLNSQPVAEMDSLAATANERDFEAVAAQVRDSIDKNQPEIGLDRLHQYVIKFVRVACEKLNIQVNRDKPLHSMFGEYVRVLTDGGHIESIITVRILKSSISVLEAFNDVRNNKSLAHDNPMLNYEESLLIFNHVAASIRFLKALQSKVKTRLPATASLRTSHEMPS